jgi:ComF family protein
MQKIATRWMSKVANFILDSLGPLRCTGCGKISTIACPNCLETIKPKLQVTPGPEPLQAIISAVNFDQKIVQELIHMLKYKGVRAAAEPLANLLKPALMPSLTTDDLIIPIPLHPRRQRERGFNQSQLIAQALHLSNAIDTNLLNRTRYTKPQVECNAEERRINLKGAFNSRAINVKRIILLDDVTTTGSTLLEAAKTLRKITPAPILGVTVARG